jgi:hypothetical protein
MRKEIWKILKNLENEKVTTNEAYHLLCDLYNVSHRRELLLAFYQHLLDNDPFPIHSSAKHREVDRFLKANNCG